MADVKITALTAISSNPVNPATFPIPMVDLLDNTITASGTTKKVTVNQILGAGGTATLASATITGALAVDTTTLVANAAGYADRVGIGTATPATTLDVAGAATITGNVTVKTGNALILNRTDNLTSTQLYDSGSNGFIIDNLNTSGIRLMFGGVTALLLNPTGNLAFPDAKGIDFSATASGSGTMTSELLNDYEEGTFTPTVIGTTTTGTVTYARQLGRYTKVGNLVTVQIYLSWSGGTGTGNLAFGGLPFTIANNANEYATGTIGVFDGIALTALYVPSIAGTWNTTILNLNQFPVGGGTNISVPYDAAGAIIMTSTYIA